jgi:hypothetical protein
VAEAARRQERELATRHDHDREPVAQLESVSTGGTTTPAFLRGVSLGELHS